MRKIIFVITVISLFCLFITADSFAQRGMIWKGNFCPSRPDMVHWEPRRQDWAKG